MEVLVFDISGRMAHFRKFYTNSSSLSYSIPPRTTLEGLIAAILGLERDSYYDDMSSDKLNIGVKLLQPIKRIMQSLNYRKATGSKALITPEGPTQIPFEILTSDNGVSYRIYVSCKDESIMKELERRIREHKYVYPPYLGAAPFNCRIEYVGLFHAQEVELEDFCEISTVVSQMCIADRGIRLEDEEISLIKEKMPRDFEPERRVKKAEGYIFEQNGKPLSIKVKKGLFKLDNDEKEYIMFL